MIPTATVTAPAVVGPAFADGRAGTFSLGVVAGADAAGPVGAVRAGDGSSPRHARTPAPTTTSAAAQTAADFLEDHLVPEVVMPR
jgi:hypothetical protein